VKPAWPIAGLFIASCVALGDESVVLLRQHVDPFDITVFAPASHMTVGRTDLTVMVQNAADHSDVPDARVTLRFERMDGGKIVEVVAPATHAKATNKLLYGATITLPNEGSWQFTAEVEAKGTHVSMPMQIIVGPAEPPVKAKWPLIVFVPVAIILFIINRRLKRRWRPKYPQARP
jgi:hypothetical protein